MTTVFSYVRLILFLGGVLIGVQLPVFVDQYGKSLEAHFLESGQNLNEFQNDAQKYFNGDMEKLIAYYKKNGDPVFLDGGESIQSIYHRYLELKNAMSNFTEGTWSAYTQAFFHPVPDIQEEVMKNYSYSVKLDLGAILFGLMCGFVLALFGEAILRVIVGAVVAV